MASALKELWERFEKKLNDNGFSFEQIKETPETNRQELLVQLGFSTILEQGALLTEWKNRLQPTAPQTQEKRGASSDISDRPVALQKTSTREQVQKFWESTIVEKDDFLHPPAVGWFGLPTATNLLYIRKSYVDLWSHLKSIYDRTIKEPRKVLLTGNPGIGKTHFLLYVLYQLRSLKAQIVLDVQSLGEIYIIYSDANVTCPTRTELLAVLNEEETWYLIDGKEPQATRASFALLTTSPRKANYKTFIKDGTHRYMPVWTIEEIEACRSFCYPNLDKLKVRQLYDRWGGIPRFVLELALVDSQQESLESAIAKSDLKKVVRSAGEITGEEDVSYKLVYMDVDTTTYNRFTMKFVSDYVARQVTQRFIKEQITDLRRFVYASAGTAQYSALRSYLFEGYAHTILQRGGTFKRKSLANGKLDYITFPVTTEKIFTDYMQISSLKVSDYGRPLAKNFETIDALVSPNLLFQMTIAKSHTISIDGYNNVTRELNILFNSDTYDLYFVVPEDVFDDFNGEQIFVKAKKPTKEPGDTEQYVIAISMSE